MRDVQRLVISGNGLKKIGFVDDDGQLVTIDDLVAHLAIDVFQVICEIRNGKKKAEETDIELLLSALDSLSNATNALAQHANAYRP